MAFGVLSSLLFLATLSGPTVELLGDQRFRVVVVLDDASARGTLAAQDAIASKAHETCRGRGTAISEGEVRVEDAAPVQLGRRAYEVSENYLCAQVWDQPARRPGN